MKATAESPEIAEAAYGPPLAQEWHSTGRGHRHNLSAEIGETSPNVRPKTRNS
jgi:hypothetical protein